MNDPTHGSHLVLFKGRIDIGYSVRRVRLVEFGQQFLIVNIDSSLLSRGG